MLPLSLTIKSALVGGPFEPAAQTVRDVLKIRWRLKHPELTELYLERNRLYDVLKRLLHPNSCIVDVGCHVGSFLSLALRFAPSGRHVAFEASPSKAELLRRKFKNIEIIAKGVSDHDGHASFLEDSNKSGTSHIGEGPDAIRIETCTLDTALSCRHVDLLKLDVEGHELAALRGSQHLINSQHPPIIFECGPTSSTPHREELFNLLTDYSYEVMTFADFLYDHGPMQYDEFRRCGLYPFRAMNYIAYAATRFQI